MNFSVKNLGQFADVSVDFGDLTLLVGAQGTGKSVFLQLFKLSQDQDYVKNTMNQFGQDWDKRDKSMLMEAYFGEGIRHMWHNKSHILRDGKDAAPSPRLPDPGKSPKGSDDAHRLAAALPKLHPKGSLRGQKLQRAYPPVPGRIEGEGKPVSHHKEN